MTYNELDPAIKPEHIFNIYSELFPSEFEFLVLYNLYINYPSIEMQYAEIRQAIVQTSQLPFLSTGKDKQIERTFKGLLRSFIERVPSKSNRFILTLHTEKIIEIATQRLNNPYLKFPLKETFETYFKMPDKTDEDITLLQSWFKFGFQNVARQIILGHLEGLKLSVDDSIKALNKILETDELTAIQMLEQFSENFQSLGDKARQISEAIKMKVEIHYKLRDIVNAYTNPTINHSPNLNDSDQIQQDRHIAIEIREEVYTFFEKVDKQLDLINMKMAFAASKIKELQETLRAQSQFKFSLKKMLVYLLENSKPDPTKWIKIPSEFPVRGFVKHQFRFYGLRYYDMGFLKKTAPFEQKNDEVYEGIERALFEEELVKQVLIQNHIEEIQGKITSDGSVELSASIFEIMNQDNGIEIGIQTGYEVIRNTPLNNIIEIKEELQSNNNSSIHLWKITISNNKD